MGKKKETQGLLDQKTRLIGIAAAGHSVGCTPFFHYAAQLSGRLQEKTGGSYGVEQHRRPGTAGEGLHGNGAGELCLPGPGGRIILSMPVPRGALPMALGAGYDDILIDFGVLEEGDTAEFLRCEKQFVVASFSEWQQENLREFAMERERTEKESWQYLAVFGSDETRKEFWRRFGILSRRIPFSADAFSVTEECGIFFEKLV